MIARFWRGWARGDNAGHYRRHFEEVVRPHLSAMEGFCGCLLLEGADGDETEMTAISFWHSRNHIHAFAGADISVARVEPAAQAVLSRFETTATHRTVSVAGWPS